MAKITLYTDNILEDATVSVTGDADSGYPESRLYDREISLYWKKTGTGQVNFTVTHATGEVDFLAIDKHNFSGETLQWQHSTDNFVLDINDAVADFDAGSGQIVKTLAAPLTNKDWRVTVSGELVTNPQCSEIFMSGGLQLRVRFDENPRASDKANVTWQDSIGGIERSTKKGLKRKVRQYAILLDETTSEITNFRAAMADLDDYSKPFYIKDHEGNYWLCRLLAEPEETFLSEGTVLMTIEILEKL